MHTKESQNEESSFERDDLDDAGLAFLRTLGMIDVLELELPQVGQVVANSATCQKVLACHATIVGTLHLLVRSHAGVAADPQDLLGTWVLLHLEEDAYPRVSKADPLHERSSLILS